MDQVTIFTSPTCTHCKAAKAYLTEKSVTFTERDITKDPAARTELISKGYRGVPVIRVGEQDVLGFDAARLNELLGL